MVKKPRHPLRIWREKQRPVVSLDVLAEKAETTKGHLGNIENDRRVPSMELMDKLCQITGLKAEDFRRAYRRNKRRNAA